MLPLLALLAGAADQPKAAPIHDGGLCAGLSWIKLTPSDKASVEYGPDFNVYRVQASSGPSTAWWGVYSGGFAQVRGNGPLLLSRDGVTVRLAREDGRFRGYLAEKSGEQNHFFGPVFRGTAADKAFFDRVDFSANARARCARKP
jgi:hypothetical protein